MRGWLGATLVIAILLLGLVMAWVLARFALPGSKVVDIGALSDFQPSKQPYELHDPLLVFLVNDAGEIIVLDPLNAVPGGYKVRWHAPYMLFIDPSRGTWFDLHGRPVRHRTLYDLVEEQGLVRYPVQFKSGRILVDISHTISP
jgi:hypothetical protein